MKPTPPGWPRISQALYYLEAAKAIDFLCEAFGFEVRIRVVGENGRIEHSELVYGEGLVMVGDVAGREEKYPYRRSPSQVGGINTQSLVVYVDDVEAHHARAVAAGAKVCAELATVDYGEEYWSDRGYECEDPGGHHWWFLQRLRNPKS
ncbi:MAG: VOC family protein [Thermoanaerobaculia bacterium]